MLSEPTTLAAAAKLIGETLSTQYGQDIEPLLSNIGMDPARLQVGGARYPWRKMQQLWVAAEKSTGDSCFGLVVGNNVRPTTFHALGFAWLASRTLLQSVQRFCRYSQLVSTAHIELKLYQEDDKWVLQAVTNNDGIEAANRLALDALFMAIVELCKQATDSRFCPVAIYFRRPTEARLDDYIKAFEAPVFFDAAFDGLKLEKSVMEATLPGENMELAVAHDRITEEYIAALDPRSITTEVRKLLIELLPSGEASQGAIAQHMHRSLSTLQRQLAAEKTNYKEIREQTRKELAEKYVREGRHSLSQVAYLLGFSDQSNFSRAFRRWTGVSPGDYSKRNA